MDTQPNANDYKHEDSNGAPVIVQPLPDKLSGSLPTVPTPTTVSTPAVNADPIVPHEQSPQNSGGKRHGDRPLLVRVIEDDDLSAFEQKTVKFGKLGFLVAVLSLIAASIAAYWVYQQFKEMSNQTDLLGIAAHQARVDSNESSKANANQLSVLQDQLTQQRKAMQIDQRAWVSVRATALSEEPEADRPVKVFLEIVNTGRTPAFDVVIKTHPSSRDSDPPQVDWKQSVGETSHGILRPGSSGDITKSSNLTLTNSLTEYNQGKNSIYIQAKITYRDVFGYRHWTTVCRLHHRGRPLSEFDLCTSGNNADGVP